MLNTYPYNLEYINFEVSYCHFQMSYMISAWARICKILGPGFAPYLPVVMGPIMKTASMKPEVALLDNDELVSINCSSMQQRKF